MKNIFKKIALLTLILVNVYVFMPESRAAEARKNYVWGIELWNYQHFDGLGFAYWHECGYPSEIEECFIPSAGWGFL